MKSKEKTNYITNKETLAEIWKSKLTYCAIFEPLPQRVIDCDFDHSGDELITTGLCRQFTYDHIPDNEQRKPVRSHSRDGVTPMWKGRHKTRRDKVECNFPPFKIFLDGREIARSHWSGDRETGHFDRNTGSLTRKLALQVSTMAGRIARRPNFAGYSYRDEMVANGMVKCLEVALKFDDRRTSNPFAYFTTIIMNDFRRVLKTEKTHQELRDSLLVSYGYNPSYSSESYR